MNNRKLNRSFRTRSFRDAFEMMEPRQHFSVTSVKAIDSGGPDFSYVESGGTVYSISSSASGAGAYQIWSSSGGSASNSKLIVDANRSGATIQSLADLTAASDGTIYFTATGGSAGGRQIYKLTSKGYTAVTSKSGASYSQLVAVGTKLYMYDSQTSEIDTINAGGTVSKLGSGVVAKMFRAKDELFYVLASDGGLWRSDGSAAGTFKVSGAITFGAAKVFGTQDFVYFEGDLNGTTNLYRTDGSNTAPTVVASDFAILTNVVAEIGNDVYFSGSYYNTAGPLAAGNQLYRISGSDSQVEKMTSLTTANGGAAINGLAAIGSSIYFNAGDGTYLNSQGTYDRELYRYDAVSRAVKLITTDDTLYPIEVSGGVLSEYYFVAAPTKDNARFGSRRLYRTSLTDDTVEEVTGLPSYTDSNGNTKEDVALVFGGSKGLFYSARNNDGTGGDYDTYFVSTPFTYIDPVTHNLVVEGTDNSDSVAVKMSGTNVVITLNGTSETRDPTTFSNMVINLKGGDDKLVTTADVTINMDVHGDTGNDSMMTGSGNDSIAGGSGKNYYYGGAGRDRLRGSNGFDYMEGGDGNDRLYGRGGSDNLHGGPGADFIYGDDAVGPFGNDTLFGESNNDKIYGYGGDDVIYGGKQNDSLFGGDGSDTMYGQDGNDTLDGEAGEDSYFGDDGDDTLRAVDGELDVLNGGPGTDTATHDSTEKAIDLIEI